MGHRPLELDVYGAGGEALPIVVFVHGGGWRAGHRSSMGEAFLDWSPSAFDRVASAGFVVASIDYRLSGEATFPAPLDDVLAAVHWLRARGREIGGDPRRIVLWGESAGGQLAALAACQEDADVAGVVAWHAPMDFLTLAVDAHADSLVDPMAADSREAAMLGASIADAPVLAMAASPLHQVHRGLPPFHLVHGSEDRFVPLRQSQVFADALAEVGVQVELEIVEGADHFWRGVVDPDSLLSLAIAFCRRVTAR